MPMTTTASTAPPLTQAISLLVACFLTIAPAAAGAQAPTEVRGEAILKHAIGQLALRSAELLKAGKVDEAMQLRSAEQQKEWKTMSAADRTDLGALMQQRAPATNVLTDAVRKTGQITIFGKEATLRASSSAGDIIAFFELEGGQWRAASGPMLIAEASDPAKEMRIEGADILKHPIAALAMEYADLLHAGKMDEAMQLATTAAQAEWKAEPASERAASAAFRKQLVPTRSELTAAIQRGGVLIIEDNARATLNLIRNEQRSTKPGVITSSSSTIAIGFAFEGGRWKLAR